MTQPQRKLTGKRRTQDTGIEHVATTNTVRKLPECRDERRSGGSDPTRLSKCRISEMVFLCCTFLGYVSYRFNVCDRGPEWYIKNFVYFFA
ncbi:hypothetical protein OG21DRAFT_187024 [Imleria badia]|nr:hypothetical protein OG21DRAFT_187024 [Imleria badia]